VLSDLVIALPVLALCLNFGYSREMSGERLPTFIDFCSQIVILFLISELTFYFDHTLMHTRYLYKYVHKWHHEYNQPLAPIAHYLHPVEAALECARFAVVAFILFGSRIHFISGLFELLQINIVSLQSHSGYAFPWEFWGNFPGTTGADSHDFHHSHNIGNYASSFAFLDYLFGTDKAYKEYLKEKQI
jgi:sterol desaturase/sphingolipid hydroxylase (fatty acid hydroxylase superfamily)